MTASSSSMFHRTPLSRMWHLMSMGTAVTIPCGATGSPIHNGHGSPSCSVRLNRRPRFQRPLLLIAGGRLRRRQRDADHRVQVHKKGRQSLTAAPFCIRSLLSSVVAGYGQHSIEGASRTLDDIVIELNLETFLGERKINVLHAGNFHVRTV